MTSEIEQLRAEIAPLLGDMTLTSVTQDSNIIEVKFAKAINGLEIGVGVSIESPAKSNAAAILTSRAKDFFDRCEREAADDIAVAAGGTPKLEAHTRMSPLGHYTKPKKESP